MLLPNTDLAGGGIVDVLQDQDYTTVLKREFLLRILFDLSFFMIAVTLNLNVIFGVIIDSFGDLRDQKKAAEDAEDDEKNVCFINQKRGVRENG